ncbi:hypothetical protein [Agrobacterium pusense]|uniref:hypothetical protein n=1 Tax=Agrobacterium pusense TaxID=648995 RepID=UPI0008822A53|nr:hypothetical protein [Agrobacterium pusense]WKD47099.1 hypothetical protein M8C82_13745 [Agrobacterium pusense]SDF17180.1 hypothetical protein SAMN05421750_10848 [Agrobacterium pusense]
MIRLVLLRIRLDEAADAMRDDMVELCKIDVFVITLSAFRAPQINLRKQEGVWQ